MTLKHKPFGLTHPTWAAPGCFPYDTAEEARAAAVRTYGEGSGHLVVGVLAVERESMSEHVAADDAGQRWHLRGEWDERWLTACGLPEDDSHISFAHPDDVNCSACVNTSAYQNASARLDDEEQV